MKWFLHLFCFLIFSSQLSSEPIFNIPANPVTPPFNSDPTLLPVVLTNNTLLPDDQVNFVIIGSTVPNGNDPIVPVYVQFDNNGVGQIVPAVYPDNSSNYSKTLDQFPTYPNAAPGARVCYLPYINSALAYFSLEEALSIPVDMQTGGLVEPSPSNPTDVNYTIQYQTFEFVYLPTQPQIFANLTAIAYFSLPIYAYLSTPDNLPTTGLYQPRPYIMSKLRRAFNAAPERQQWTKLFLRNLSDYSILRVLGTGQAMAVRPTPLFDNNYLDNFPAYGYSFIGDIWSNPDSFYRNNVLSLQIPPSAISSGDTYTGVINPDNTITFTGQNTNNTVNFAAPNTDFSVPGVLTTTEAIFEGQPLWTTFNTGIYTDDPQQLSKLFEEAIIAGLLPTTDTVSNPYFTANMNRYYTINPNLSPAGQITGPWYDLYSKVLHGLGSIYTFSFDEPLWPDVQISSQTFQPNVTFLGLTLAPVVKANTTTQLIASPNAPIAGDLVTFTATVTGNPLVGDPSGRVVFTVDGQVQKPVVLDNNNQAVFQTSSLSVGEHTITATYIGEPSVYFSSTASTTLTIAPALLLTSTSSLTSSPNPALFGTSVDFVASVNGTGAVPDGTVVFVIDGVSQAPLNLVNGQATLTTSALSIGIHQVSVNYSGSATYLPSSSGILKQVIVDPNKLNSIISLTSSKNPAMEDENVTFSVVVSGSGPVPTGTVTFIIDEESKTPVNLVNGQASFTIASLTSGIHSVIADYSGSIIYSVSTSIELKQVIGDPTKLNSAISLTSSQNPSLFGASIDLTAIVTGQNANTPTGSVTFVIDGNSQTPVSLINGQALLTIATLSTGIHQISAQYSGSPVYSTSVSQPITQVVLDPNKLVSTITVSSSQNPSLIGNLVTFTAVVDGNNSIPTGSVTFVIDGTPQSPVNLFNGRATFGSAILSKGVHTVSALYSGSLIYSASASENLYQIIIDNSQRTTSTTLTTSKNPVLIGKPVTFTAQVEGSSQQEVKGSVTFYVNNSAQATVKLVNGQASLTLSNLMQGLNSVQAVYEGNKLYAGSGSNTISELVILPQKIATTVKLTSSLNPALVNQLIKFTATIKSSSQNTPQGNVAFLINGSLFAQVPLVNGQATFQTAGLTPGKYEIQAVYLGNEIYQASLSNTLIQLIGTVLSPRDLKGRQVENKFATQTDIINVISWKAPLIGPTPVAYKIYKDSELTQLLKTVKVSPNSSKKNYEFVEHNREKGKTYHYYIVAVDSMGNTSLPAELSIERDSNS